MRKNLSSSVIGRHCQSTVFLAVLRVFLAVFLALVLDRFILGVSDLNENHLS